MKILIASQNRDKVQELVEIIQSNGLLPITIWDIFQGKEIPSIVESGMTLMENARIKAVVTFAETNIPVISDDTGLEVDVLNGQPGVFSSRYAGENCSYAENIEKLLKEMRKVPFEKRTARFKAVACFFDGNRELFSEGVVEGMILEKASGSSGFGYDPVFFLPEYKKTYAELTIDEKNIVSHRKITIDRLCKQIHTIYKTQIE